MFKAVKECVKNWLVTHERLYWYIVVGLAVLGFGIVTAFGCAKLESANAAQEESIVVPWYGNDVSLDLEGYPYYVVIYGTGVTGDTKVLLGWAPFVMADSSGHMFKGSENNQFEIYGLYAKPDILNSCDIADVLAVGNYTSIRSNHTIYNSDGSVFHEANPFNPDAYITTKYSLDAPYIKFDSLDIYCPLATTPQTFKQNADITEIYKDYDDWYWQYNGTIVNNSDIVPEEYTLSVAFTVQLPTYDYVSELHILGVLRQYLMPKNVPASVKEWMASDTDFVEYTFTQEFVLDVASDGTFSLKIPYSVIHGLMVYAYPDLLETFGTCTESDIDFCDIWMAHLYVEQCNSLLTVSSGSNKYYGRSVMNIFSKGIINRAVTAEVLVDILNATDAELESAISDALKIGYDEALKQNQSDMDNMQNDLDSIFEVDGAFSGNLEGTDLWSGFSNLSEGLASLGPSIKQLSSLTGSVIAFIPAPIASIISFTLFAICIIAIIKAIRG